MAILITILAKTVKNLVFLISSIIIYISLCLSKIFINDPEIFILIAFSEVITQRLILMILLIICREKISMFLIIFIILMSYIHECIFGWYYREINSYCYVKVK